MASVRRSHNRSSNSRPCRHRCKCCKPSPAPTCPPYRGKDGLRGERGTNLSHTSYVNTAPYEISTILEDVGDVVIPTGATGIEFGNIYGATPGQSIQLQPGVHHLKFNANLTIIPNDPIEGNLYFMTVMMIGTEIIRVFRQSIPDGPGDLTFEGVFVPSITFGTCVCNQTAQNVVIHSFIIAAADDASFYTIGAGDAQVSINSALDLSLFDPLLVTPPAQQTIDEYTGNEGPKGWNGLPFNTTAFQTPLLPNLDDAAALEYDPIDPLANPIQLAYKNGRCTALRLEDGTHYMLINQADFYRIHFSATLNVDFVDPTDEPYPEMMQINLLATVNDGPPIVLTHLRTTVDPANGAYKIIDGFLERTFAQGDRIALYIHYFFSLEPVDEPNVLLGILSAKTANVRSGTRTVQTSSQGLGLVEKMQ